MTYRIYQVTVLANRGTKLVSVTETNALHGATKLFHQEAGRVIHDRDASVLLSIKTGENSGTTLAAKSTDGFHVEFNQAYYSLLSSTTRT